MFGYMASTVWKGHLSFGLVSIPVKLVRAARAERVQMHQLDRRTGARVRQVLVPATPPPEPEETVIKFRTPPPKAAHHISLPAPAAVVPAQPALPKPIAGENIVKAVEVERGRYVELEPEDIERAAPKNSDAMEILEFVHFSEIDPVYLETSYYVQPDRGGEKPYALLFATLKQTGRAAVAEMVMSRRDHVVVLRPGAHGILLHTLFYQDEVRAADEFHAEIGQVSSKEQELATKLVEALEAKFDPSQFKDRYRERLKQMIAEKAQTGAVSEAAPEAASAPVIDIMAALRQSLERARKPPATETRAAEPRPKRSKRAS